MKGPTLAGELRRRAAERPDEVAIRFTEAGDSGVTATWTWQEHWHHAERVARGLGAAGLGAGDRVIVLAPDVRAAVAGHFGAWAAGVTPIHVGLPYRLGDPAAFIGELRTTAARLRCRALLHSSTVAPFVPRGEEWQSANSGDGGTTQPLSIEEMPRGGSLDRQAGFLDPSAGALARRAGSGTPVVDPDSLPPPDLVQLTSGSTGQPRAVVIPHERLILHLKAIAERLPATPGDSGVTWLPLYHDMGLIGGLLYPFFTGFPVHLLSPLTFQSHPMAWLTALSEGRATHTAGPPSAYALLQRLATRAASSGVRLDRLRCAMIGAEPISPALLRSFADAFAPCGLRREAFFPVYGLAEATVAVTFPPVLRPPRVERLDRTALERTGRAEPPSEGPALELVSVGSPLPHTQVRIMGSDNTPVPERHTGEIQVRSPMLMACYDGEPEATAATFDGEWLRTGDLGFLDGGELFITGRAKDILIKAGHNVHPEPVEAAAGAIEGIRAGCVVAVGVWSERYGTERIVVAAETRLPVSEWPSLRERVRDTLKLTGVAADEIVLLAPGSLPKTTSGKLRRAEVRRQLAGTASLESPPLQPPRE